MKILSLHNSYQTPGVDDQLFAWETDLPRGLRPQVLLYQGIPAVRTLPVGSEE